MALGEDVGRALGVRAVRMRLAAFASVALLCGAATAAAGPIGFVGLVVPHAVRLLVGPDHRWVLPYSLLTAPILLLGSDILGRVVARPGEVEAVYLLAYSQGLHGQRLALVGIGIGAMLASVNDYLLTRADRFPRPRGPAARPPAGPRTGPAAGRVGGDGHAAAARRRPGGATGAGAVPDPDVRVLAVCPGPTRTSFFDTVGESAAIGGRMMAADAVVRAALRALDRDWAYVVPGLGNSLNAHLTPRRPRRLVAALAKMVTRSACDAAAGAPALSAP